MSAEQVEDRGNAIMFYADGICSVMKVGNVTHLIFTSRQPQVDQGGKIYRIVEARVIVPNECMQEIGRTILTGRPVIVEQREIDGFERPLN